MRRFGRRGRRFGRRRFGRRRGGFRMRRRGRVGRLRRIGFRM